MPPLRRGGGGRLLDLLALQRVGELQNVLESYKKKLPE